MPSATALFAASVCALVAVASANAQQQLPPSFSYEANSDFRTTVDVQMTMNEIGFGALLLRDLHSQFAGPQTAGVMIVVEFRGPIGGNPMVKEYTTPTNFDSQFSSLIPEQSTFENLQIMISNQASVSLSISGDLAHVTLPFGTGTGFDESQFELSFYASTEFDTNGNPVLPNGLTSFWDSVKFPTKETTQLKRQARRLETPTEAPTKGPTFAPTEGPTLSPSQGPTTTREPTEAPTKGPTAVPTKGPTAAPTKGPTTAPTKGPTAPTSTPTSTPTKGPTSAPSHAPTSAPSHAPTAAPSQMPTAAPSQRPTAPTKLPTTAPTKGPTAVPTNAVEGNEISEGTPSAAPTSESTAARTTTRPTSKATSKPTSSAMAITHSFVGLVAALAFGIHML